MSDLRTTDMNKPPQAEGGKGMDFLLAPFVFVVLMWGVFWLGENAGIELFRWGIKPRSTEGLKGILFSPLIHGNFMHLTNNSLPVLVLGSALFYFYPKKAFRVILWSWLGTGILVWIMARDSYHIGASGLIYALAGFIFLNGLLSRKPNLLAMSLLVVFLYGSLVWGVLPLENEVSWEAHLSGGISGLLLAVIFYQRSTVNVSEDLTLVWDEEQELIKILKAEEKSQGFNFNNDQNVLYHFKPKERNEPNS